MFSAIISGDIIAYTSLNKKDRDILDLKIIELKKVLENEFSAFVRLIKGDYIECYIPETYKVLRVTLIIKAYIKSITKDVLRFSNINDERVSLFKKYGIRLAIGIGKLSRLNIDKGLIDGEAIYFSGRLLSKQSTSDKNKISIKNTLYLQTYNSALTDEFIPLLNLIDEIMNRNTAKQSEIIYYKLLGLNEKRIAEKTKRYQSTVNQHSTSSGWNSIEKAVLRFEKVIKEKVI